MSAETNLTDSLLEAKGYLILNKQSIPDSTLLMFVSNEDMIINVMDALVQSIIKAIKAFILFIVDISNWLLNKIKKIIFFFKRIDNGANDQFKKLDSSLKGMTSVQLANYMNRILVLIINESIHYSKITPTIRNIEISFDFLNNVVLPDILKSSETLSIADPANEITYFTDIEIQDRLINIGARIDNMNEISYTGILNKEVYNLSELGFTDMSKIETLKKVCSENIINCWDNFYKNTNKFNKAKQAIMKEQLRLKGLPMEGHEKILENIKNTNIKINFYKNYTTVLWNVCKDLISFKYQMAINMNEELMSISSPI